MLKTDLYLGNCLEVMAELPAQSIDMVLCDLPYGVTGHAWDAVIPFSELWAAYTHLVKPSGAIVLTATGIFAHTLAVSNKRVVQAPLVLGQGAACGISDC